MGNGGSRVVGCFVVKKGADLQDFVGPLPLDEGLGHSFCYVRPPESPTISPSASERFTVDSSTLDSETLSGSFRHEIWDDHPPTFKTISGASVSANVSAARTGNQAALLATDLQEPAASFESTSSFAAIPLQPSPHGFMSGPLGFASGPLDRGAAAAAAAFMSGPIEKGIMLSGPIDPTDKTNFSAPLARGRPKPGLHRLMRSVSGPMKNTLSRTFSKHSGAASGWMHRFFLHPITQFPWPPKEPKSCPKLSHNCNCVDEIGGPSEGEYRKTRNLQWAHGKAGEDRVHVVLSEEQGWLFIGIYDGFSGPDAPDFLMSHLYRAIDEELEGLLWDYEDMPSGDTSKNDCLKAERTEPGSGFNRENGPDIPSAEVIPCNLAESCNLKNVGFELCCSEIVEKNEKVETDVQPNCTETSISAAASAPTVSITGQGRKSKRLYELLQMERWNGQGSIPLSTLVGDQRKGLCDFQSSSDCLGSGEASQEEQLRSTSSLNIKGECASHRAEDPSASGVRNDCGRQNALPASFLGQRQNPGLLFLSSKIRKMCRKQKSLRKKLFRWSYDWHREETCVDEKPAEQIGPIRRCKSGNIDHNSVLRAMARALERTEEAYMKMVEEALDKNPELALMGSCVLVMLMKDQDVYVMNLGDSRVILAQERPNDCHLIPSFMKDDARHGNRSSRESLVRMELDRISEESPMHNQNIQVNKVNKNMEISLCRVKMRAVQLSTDHSTSVEEEVSRIKAEHLDDNQAILNDRVKGQLKVTRAFGAGFLKKPSCNEALLERFRVDYVGTAPYVSCIPNVIHHRLSSSDRFLVLSSDGLYQYLSNEEVVAHVTWFMENVPEGDPAQYLIAELLFRAAKKNRMDFHELLDIPHGDRRKYHDDVYVMVVSLEGRIWRSSG